MKQVSRVALRTNNLNAFLTPHILIKSSQIGFVHNLLTHSKNLEWKQYGIDNSIWHVLNFCCPFRIVSCDFYFDLRHLGNYITGYCFIIKPDTSYSILSSIAGGLRFSFIYYRIQKIRLSHLSAAAWFINFLCINIKV